MSPDLSKWPTLDILGYIPSHCSAQIYLFPGGHRRHTELQPTLARRLSQHAWRSPSARQEGPETDSKHGVIADVKLGQQRQKTFPHTTLIVMASWGVLDRKSVVAHNGTKHGIKWQIGLPDAHVCSRHAVSVRSDCYWNVVILSWEDKLSFKWIFFFFCNVSWHNL